MLKSNSWSNSSNPTSPDYLGLVGFLVEPLLESPDSLSVDCEKVNKNQRVWIRLAFEGNNKGRIFGRGGRNLQAIRVVLQVAATAAGQSLYLDIYDIPGENSRSSCQTGYRSERKFVRKKTRIQPPPLPRLSVRSHWEQ
ncbi:MAG: KH domain-containing protein [cyanobacterium endosymbiont of Rhopalodia musculus]|uniref:KH domain-containing protein n=1 Tax=cyanobacterium endosymbiont of Epithemia clementina EcSB TaxID=3034674 RepID=UPI0024812CAB|nr:KH domain-containing protein [cyanobacterium endosymbiont of Epithemia clementina EcSB]WGT67614.1 KH domain-containing protein [cyanobacterium endosymbiont of Epithemia clementina EcSB]